jgi:hypothetical protein
MKNQKITFLAASFIFLGLLACNSDKASEQTTLIENTASATAENSLDVPPLSSIPESGVSQPITTIPAPSGLNSAGQFANSSVPLNTSLPLNASSRTVAATKNSVRLNPAHGQPGHDCAIAVGAPLKGSVAAVPAPAPVQATAPNFSVEPKSVAAPVQATAPNFGVNPNAKVNPAHGQPGHDCAVAVGALLPVK